MLYVGMQSGTVAHVDEVGTLCANLAGGLLGLGYTLVSGVGLLAQGIDDSYVHSLQGFV